jgi:anhydro-N-acetylmuramic acid kinase
MRVLGIMSGSSLDGLDLALCHFTEGDGRRAYDVLATHSVQYPAELHDRLLHMSSATAFELAEAHAVLGRFMGESAKRFLQEAGPADLIASHGHTIFHQPRKGFTTQIGCGAHIAAITGVPAVVDFRTKDVAYHGQGAPLVPIGERDLFSGYDGFLNLGGIANISVHKENTIAGTDLCFCNQALNFLAAETGASFDASGAIARSGRPYSPLLADLKGLPFLSYRPPYTLGREHFEQAMRPLLDNGSIPVADRLCTVVTHIAMVLGDALGRNQVQRCLITGGGAHNTFLVERTGEECHTELVVPDARTVEFKEALIFAYLGWLRWNEQPNALASVTGATRNSVGGAVYLPY